MTLYDLSPPVSPALAVWPGDTPVSREVLLDMQRGDHLTLSALRASVHAGAHADGPNHYGADAPSIDARRLDYYLGPAQVVHCPVSPGTCVTAPDFVAGWRAGNGFPAGQQLAPRVLIATGTYPDPNRFHEDFAALAPELVDFLHERGVITVGTDAPSVDPFTSKTLAAHKRFLAHDMAILETLLLRDVPAGVYELIALPLKLVGFDASPVRAILRPFEE